MPAAAQVQPVAIPAKDFGPVWTGFMSAPRLARVARSTSSNRTHRLLSPRSTAAAAAVFWARSTVASITSSPNAASSAWLAEGSYSGFQGDYRPKRRGTSANVNMNTGLGWAVLARAGVLANPTTLLYLAGGYAGQNIRSDGFATGGGASASFRMTRP